MKCFCCSVSVRVISYRIVKLDYGRVEVAQCSMCLPLTSCTCTCVSCVPDMRFSLRKTTQITVMKMTSSIMTATLAAMMMVCWDDELAERPNNIHTYIHTHTHAHTIGAHVQLQQTKFDITWVVCINSPTVLTASLTEKLHIHAKVAEQFGTRYVTSHQKIKGAAQRDYSGFHFPQLSLTRTLYIP